MRTLYLEPSLRRRRADVCDVVEVSGLLRELILRAVDLGPVLLAADGEASHDCFIEVLLGEIERTRSRPLHAFRLPDGTDPRLRKLLAELRADPSDRRTLEEWGRSVGASTRTLTRLFASEIGMSFPRWRQQLRLQRAMTLLALGWTVSEVALEVGYDSLSAFINMFTKATGSTPSAYRGEVHAPDRTVEGMKKGGISR